MGHPPIQQVPPPQAVNVNIDFGQIYNANKPVGSKGLIEKLGAKRGGELLSLALIDMLPANPMLAADVVFNFEPVLLGLGRVKKLDLFLRSTGGVAEVPWRLVSLIRSFCEEFETIIPRAAMSGATHIAIGADNLVMGPLSMLGSVDPTRNHALLPRDPQGNQIPVSVQDLKHCLEFVRRNVPKGEELGPIFAQLFNHVSPLAIGALEQSYELSRLITAKVLATRNKTLDPKHVEKVVEQLAGKYFSHGYPISRAEVESDLQLPMTKADPGDGLFEAIEELNSYYTSVFEKNVQVSVGAPVPLTFRITGFVETAKMRRVLCQLFAPDGRPMAGTWLADTNS